ncbi:MAG: amidohydrolase family protein [Flavobacteriales bacterium]|nr:amidohydrolase family protein [Flavobacteriales bacterium]
MKLKLIIVFLLSTSLSGWTQKRSFLLMEGTAHLGNGEVINHSLIGVRDGKIVLVANSLVTRPNLSEFDTVIQIPGKHVYPGFIATDVSLGLVEVESVRATVDNAEAGEYNPNARTLIAYNTDSKIIPTVRSNGVLMAQVTPRGGVVSGSSSIMKLNGWNWEDAAYKADDGIHVNWPRNFQQRGWWAEPAEGSKNDKYQMSINDIKKFFEEAKANSEDAVSTNKDLRFEAMRGLFDGSKTLFVHANFAREIADAVQFMRDMKIKKMVIVGGYDSWMLTDLLRENKVAVILRRIHELPFRSEDDIDLPFKIPALLQKAGVLYCLGNAGDQEAAQTRNLPFLAGTIVPYGVEKEIALMSITLNAAKILGIDKWCGSLEPGKEATLFISDGDALDMRSNNVTHAWIKGEKVDLNNIQKELYSKYKTKYGK